MLEKYFVYVFVTRENVRICAFQFISAFLIVNINFIVKCFKFGLQLF